MYQGDNSSAFTRHSRGRHRVGVAAICAAAAILSGCSGTDNSAEDATSTSAEATASTGPSTAPERPSPGCDNEAAAADQAKETLKVGDKDRWWLVTAPANDDTPRPVVYDFHGLLEGAEVHSAMSGLAPFAAENDFVLITPDGYGDPIHWEGSTDEDTNYDLQFVRAMYDAVASSRCVDLNRVYATGLSNGAMMSSLVACTMPELFAAVAPVAGINVFEDCDTSRPVPVLAFHGTNDQILKYNGGVGGIPGFTEGASDPMSTPPAEYDLNGEGYPATVAAWAKRNDCDDAFEDTTVKTGEERTPEVIERVYDCPPDAAVEFYSVVGAGHTWPGSSFSAGLGNVMGPTSLKTDANEEIWTFFQRFALPG